MYGSKLPRLLMHVIILCYVANKYGCGSNLLFTPKSLVKGCSYPQIWYCKFWLIPIWRHAGSPYVFFVLGLIWGRNLLIEVPSASTGVIHETLQGGELEQPTYTILNLPIVSCWSTEIPLQSHGSVGHRQTVRDCDWAPSHEGQVYLWPGAGGTPENPTDLGWKTNQKRDQYCLLWTSKKGGKKSDKLNR